MLKMGTNFLTTSTASLLLILVVQFHIGRLENFAGDTNAHADAQEFLRIKQKFLALFKPLPPQSASTVEEGLLQASAFPADVENNLEEIARIIPAGEPCSYMNPVQKMAMNKLVELLKDQPTIDEALDLAENVRRAGKIDLREWYYAVMSWSFTQRRMQSVPKPNPVDVMPSAFIHSEALDRAKELGKKKSGTHECVIVDGSAGADNGPNNDVWYWREDLMNNAFHMFYHLHYGPGGRGAVRENRRSELFYFLHREVLARMDAERFANGLPKVQSLVWGRGSVLEEGYNPHLNDTMTSFNWIPRAPGTLLADIEMETGTGGFINVTMSQVKVSERRVYEAIETDTLLGEDGTLHRLDNLQGVDLLGDVIEGNAFQINRDYYNYAGMAIHDSLHLAVSISGRPPGDVSSFGVMTSPTTSFRDVIFYPWHSYINDLFDAHKTRLRPYTPTGGELPLIWAGITVTQVHVQPGPNYEDDGPLVDQLWTYFDEKRFELRGGLDHLGDFEEPVDLCAKHLNHENFVYKIVVNSDHFFTRPATIRLFLAPRQDEVGNRFSMLEQRNLIFTLDVFQTTLNPGENVVYRTSNASTVTIPWLQTLAELENGTWPHPTPACGCGLPQHLSIPKGKVEGMKFDLIVMVTNFVDDAVEYEEPECRAAYLYCGLPGTKYPDAKPMGYPFDRLPYSVDADGNPVEIDSDSDSDDALVRGRVAQDLEEYVAHVSNMATAQITITHLPLVEP